jgi:hypothetical protein
VGVGVMVLVTIGGVKLTVGEFSVPVWVIVRVSVGVGVPRVSGARERAIKPTQ